MENAEDTADAGDLERLPLELRQEIYAMVLIESPTVELVNYGGGQNNLKHFLTLSQKDVRTVRERYYEPQAARSDHKRNRHHRGMMWVSKQWVEVPSQVALLCVNKRVCAEATPVLYNRTKFQFGNVCTIRRFLWGIGDNKQYLRHVGIFADSWYFGNGLFEARYGLEALAEAKGLQTFEIDHWDVCDGLGVQAIIKLCEPLLESLKGAYEDNGLNKSIFDVIKITSPQRWECHCTRPCSHQNMGMCEACAGEEMKQYEERSSELAEVIKEVVAAQHGLTYG